MANIDKLKHRVPYLLELHLRNRMYIKELESLLGRTLLNHFPAEYQEVKNEIEEVISRNEQENEEMLIKVKKMWSAIQNPPTLLDRIFNWFGYVRIDAGTDSTLDGMELESVELSAGIPGILGGKAKLRPRPKTEEGK